MTGQALSGGDALMKRLEEIAERMGGGSVSIGFLEGATSPEGIPEAAIAFWNEFGKPGQPPRPFFRQMIAAESPGWPATMARLAKTTNYDGDKVLGLMGLDIQHALQQSINNFTTPALAESTIARKGFPKPLIDKADMLNAVNYELSNSKGEVTFAG